MTSFVVTPYPTYNPSNGTSCVVWFDAADPMTMNMSSATVTNWRSKGAYSLFASTFSTCANPILSTYNGYPGLYFNGSTICISTNAIANGGTVGSTWIACSVNLTPITATIPIDASLVIASGTPEKAIRYTYNINATLYSIHNSVLRQDTNNNANGIRGFIDTAATLSTFINGSSFNTVNSAVTFNAHTNQGFQLGAWNNGRLNGFINEILIFSTALTTQQYQTVEGYLAQKWGYTGSLPAGHPGKISTLYNSNQLYTLPTFTNVNFFSPPQISGCCLWLDGQDNTKFTFSSGSNIATWLDKSGSNNTATASGSPVLQTYTINGKQSVYLPNAPYFGGSISITGTTVTTFAVAITTATLPLTGSDQRLVSLENGAGPDYGRTDGTIALFNQGNSSWIGTWRVSGPIANNGITTSVPFLACSKYDGTNGYLWKDGSPGSLASSAATGTFAVTKYGIGNRANNSSEFWRGYIGEVIIYNTALSDTDRRSVEAYLAQKWGLNSNLPANHPGLTQKVYVSGPKTGSLPAQTTSAPVYWINATTFSAANINLVGGAAFSSGRLEITDSASTEASAGWFTSRVSLVQQFTSVFNISFQTTNADGATFCIQNINNTSAIGSLGGGLGFQGIGANSFCITLKTYDGGAANFSTEVLTGGAAPNLTGASGILDTQLGLTGAGTTWNFRVTVTWNGFRLNYTILNTDNNNSFTSNAAYNIPAIVGTNNPYIGFTGGTGGLTEFCYVTSWQHYTY